MDHMDEKHAVYEQLILSNYKMGSFSALNFFNNFIIPNNSENIRISLVWASLHKKWSFPLRISSVNVTKSAASRVLGHIYWINP